MRTVRIVLGMLLVGAVALVVGAGPASASPPTDFRGHFTADIAFDNCTQGTLPEGPASGMWRVNVHEKTVTARFVIYLDGVLHVAYTASMPRVTVAGADWAGRMMTGAGELTISLTDDEFSYQIKDYNYKAFDPEHGATCDFVTYSGELHSAH